MNIPFVKTVKSIINTLTLTLALAFFSSVSLADNEALENAKAKVPNYSSKEIYSLYTAKKDSQQEKNIPDYTQVNSFSCKEQIFAVIKMNNPEVSLNKTVIIPGTVIWINPEGDVQEKTKVYIPFYKGQARTFAWLKLHQPSGASMIGFIDDNFGLEKFIGDWSIKLEVDRHEVAEFAFKIIC